MKHTTRILALLLALVLCLGLSVTAFATGEKGSITINDAVDGQTYTIYRILELESYDTTTNAYSYKVTNASWKTFLTTGAGKDYFTVDEEQGYATWKAAKDDATVAAFAKAALKYAKEQSIQSVDTKQAADGTVTFTGLDLGYYLVDSTLGTLCSLDTTKPKVDIREKNVAPTSDKQVQEDYDSKWGTVNDADIGQTVNFQSTITAQAGAEKYVFHDTMDSGLTFDEKSVTVKLHRGETTVEVTAENYQLQTQTTTPALSDGHTFDVVFTPDFCNTLQNDDKIVISYNATLNANAVIAGAGNKNKSHITYGEKNTATHDSTTTTHTWEVKVFKYTMKDGQETGLAEVKFELSKKEDGTDPIQLIALGNNVYRVPVTGEENTITEITTLADGNFTIQGLDSDTYYLVEKETPGGYNKLEKPVKIVISKDGKINVTEQNAEGVDQIKVENKSGALLPSTGGMGTTIFYVLGGILAVGAAVLLVTKKRMERG